MEREIRIPTQKRAGERIVVIEFTRDELESLALFYDRTDIFAREIRAAISELDRLEGGA